MTTVPNAPRPEPWLRTPAAVSSRTVDAGVGQRRDSVDARVWQREDMRLALAQRDIVTVYRLLQRFGMSQRAIAARTGQCQSEISEILRRQRQIVSYPVLERIALGFGLPRGWLGLGYDDETDTLIQRQPHQVR